MSIEPVNFRRNTHNSRIIKFFESPEKSKSPLNFKSGSNYDTITHDSVYVTMSKS